MVIMYLNYPLCEKSVILLNRCAGLVLMKRLIHQEKREVVDGREHVVSKEKQYLVRNLSKDVDTFYGKISKGDLAKPAGSVLTSSTGKEFIILDASFADGYANMKKLPQTVPLKDAGLIIAETGVNKNSLVVDGGVGSGALAAVLANVVKQVVSYEVREDCIRTAEENIASLGLTNITIKNQSLYEGIDETDVDLVTLDVPEPWRVIPCALKSLKVGGFLVSYSPSVPQVQDFVNAVREERRLLLVKTVEVIERQWEVDGRRVRPKTAGIGHSGFLTFVRKLRD